MPSTNKTKHLGLCQWVETDPFLMADMNDTLETIDRELEPRLKLELLRDWELNAGTTQQIDLDVSDIPFSDYFFIIMSFRYIQSSRVLINNFQAGEVTSTAKFIFLPLKDPVSEANYIMARERSISTGYAPVKYPNISTISFPCSTGYHSGGTKIRMWGVK